MTIPARSMWISGAPPGIGEQHLGLDLASVEPDPLNGRHEPLLQCRHGQFHLSICGQPFNLNYYIPVQVYNTAQNWVRKEAFNRSTPLHFFSAYNLKSLTWSENFMKIENFYLPIVLFQYL